MFVSDIGALAGDPKKASAARCRAVLNAAGRVRTWLGAREVEWMARLIEAEGRDQPDGAFAKAIEVNQIEQIKLAS